MLVGYMRVSTSEQSLDLQRDALKGTACERFYQDTCGGGVTERPGLTQALDQLRAGDALVVWKLDRIGCSLSHVVELVATLQARDVGLIVLTGGIDTSSSTGRLVFGIFATFSRPILPNSSASGSPAQCSLSSQRRRTRTRDRSSG